MFDFDWQEPDDFVVRYEPEDDYKIQMVLTYVPEAEYLDFTEAYMLARTRDLAAAEQLEMDVENA